MFGFMLVLSSSSLWMSLSFLQMRRQHVQLNNKHRQRLQVLIADIMIDDFNEREKQKRNREYLQWENDYYEQLKWNDQFNKALSSGNNEAKERELSKMLVAEYAAANPPLVFLLGYGGELD